jgi:hypothetical protein
MKHEIHGDVREGHSPKANLLMDMATEIVYTHTCMHIMGGCG